MRPVLLRSVLAACTIIALATAPVVAQTPNVVITTAPLAATYAATTLTTTPPGGQITPPVKSSLDTEPDDAAATPAQKMHVVITVPIDVTSAIVPASSSREPASLGTYSVGCAVGASNVRVFATLAGTFVMRNAWGHAQTQPVAMPVTANAAGNQTLTATLGFEADVPVKRLIVGLKTGTYVCAIHNNGLHNPMFPDRSVTDTVRLP